MGCSVCRIVLRSIWEKSNKMNQKMMSNFIISGKHLILITTVAGLPVRDVRSATSMKQSTLLTHHDGCLPEYGQELDKHFKL